MCFLLIVYIGIILFLYYFHRLFDGLVQTGTVYVNALLKQRALVPTHRQRYVLSYILNTYSARSYQRDTSAWFDRQFESAI